MKAAFPISKFPRKAALPGTQFPCATSLSSLPPTPQITWISPSFPAPSRTSQRGKRAEFLSGIPSRAHLGTGFLNALLHRDRDSLQKLLQLQLLLLEEKWDGGWDDPSDPTPQIPGFLCFSQPLSINLSKHFLSLHWVILTELGKGLGSLQAKIPSRRAESMTGLEGIPTPEGTKPICSRYP